MELLERITFDPEIMGGKPCIRGMRVTVVGIWGTSMLLNFTGIHCGHMGDVHVIKLYRNSLGLIFVDQATQSWNRRARGAASCDRQGDRKTEDFSVR